MTSEKTPMVSVIMGIYNCQDTLAEALDSLLQQTFQDFEIVLCNDGSTDNSLSIAKNYVARYPDKIVLIENEKNMGLNFTLNHCLKVARGKYIARMDGDDLSLPDRFRVEVEYLESHPDCALVGVFMELFDEDGVWGHMGFVPEPKPEDLLRATPFGHAGCMIRKSVFDEVEGYSESKWLLRVEDRHLWYKIYKRGYRGVNLTRVLYSCRDDRNAYTRRKFRHRFNEFYVHHLSIRAFKLPFHYYRYALKPILVGLLPYPIYRRLHKKKLAETVSNQEFR